MGRQQASPLVVCMLTFVCLCKTLDGATTTKPRMDNVEGWEGPVAEMQQTLQWYLEKINELEDAMSNVGQHLVSGAPGPPGSPGSPGLPGRDGRDGEHGRDGEDGANGEDGRDGEDGADGEDGEGGRDGENGRDGADGSNGRDGRDGMPGPQGLPGDVGDPGAVGPKGDRGSTGPQAGGATYTRWGRTTCGSDSTLVYAGFMGKTYYNYKGGGINFQCAVNNPEYNSDGNPSYSGRLSGTEYESGSYGIFENEANQQNAPCAVCYANNRTSTLMVPGKRSCPTNWHKEYEGYLMSSRYPHESPSTFECVDENPEYIRGEEANNNGALLYFNKADCSQGVHCPEYDGNKAITCVVCTN